MSDINTRARDTIGVILSAAALATYIPARRAATIDPMETMKVE